jgi:hypothetical protein
VRRGARENPDPYTNSNFSADFVWGGFTGPAHNERQVPQVAGRAGYGAPESK